MNVPKSTLVFLLPAILLPYPLTAEHGCTIRQITDAKDGGSFSPSLDGEAVAFESTADLIGSRSDINSAIFLFDGSELTQITDSTLGDSFDASLDALSVAFVSRTDQAGGKQDDNLAIFLFDGEAIRQITDSTTGDSAFPSLNEGAIAFESSADLTGENPDPRQQLFLFEGSSIRQITTSGQGISGPPSLDSGAIAFRSPADLTGRNPDNSFEILLFDSDGFQQVTESNPPRGAVRIFDPSLSRGSIAFASSDDLTGENPDGSGEVFLFDATSISQITDSIGRHSGSPSLHQGIIAFASEADLTGRNPDHNTEIFIYDGSRVHQITHTTHPDGSFSPSLSGSAVAFESRADLTGGNGDKNSEIFVATCPGLDLPPGPYLSSPEIPDFRFKVRITAGNQVIIGRQEAECIGETLCVSGALPGRSELFLRIIGPRPNGFLWTNLVRFTPSRVEMWAEQISSGTVNYYDLAALPREDAGLSGLVDKQAFPQGGSGAGALAGAAQPVLRARELTLWEADRPHRLAPSGTGLPGPLTFISPAFPDFRFTIRIFSGAEEQPVQLESDCIPETVCVSGAVPGRSELFLRIIGPRPNGHLWVNLVRFTTSRIEVEIEQLSTGDRNTYVLDPVPRESDELPGRVDKEAFLPQ